MMEIDTLKIKHKCTTAVHTLNASCDVTVISARYGVNGTAGAK